MGPISDADQVVVSALKREGVLLKFDPKDLSGSTKNGGVAVICSDGDTDMQLFHRLISHRPHCQQITGGSLRYVPSFRGYRKRFAIDLMGDLQLLMNVKETKTLFLYFHTPCGMAIKYECGIREQIALAAEAREFFARDSFFVPKKIHILFHTKKLMDGILEQNTYKIVV